MSDNNSVALFACSRCFTRHPFEELSPGQQLCKECRGTFPVTKCTYCRSEFQQTSKATSSICKKCEANVKAYGKPTACQYCNIIAAFIGNKCQRCTNSERKYGPAVTCEQCKQRCAFDRHDDERKIDGKVLCWLCTLSFKRTLARTKHVDHEAQRHKHRSSHHKMKSSHHKRSHRSDIKSSQNCDANLDSHPPDKKAKVNPLSGVPNIKRGEVDPNSSDHVVAMTNLKETIVSLQRQVNQKDQVILTKDKFITELKAQHFTSENELRNAMKNTDRLHDAKCNQMTAKIQQLLKEVAVLSKANKSSGGSRKKEKLGGGGAASSSAVSVAGSGGSADGTLSGGGSGTDSPSTN